MIVSKILISYWEILAERRFQNPVFAYNLIKKLKFSVLSGLETCCVAPGVAIVNQFHDFWAEDSANKHFRKNGGIVDNECIFDITWHFSNQSLFNSFYYTPALHTASIFRSLGTRWNKKLSVNSKNSIIADHDIKNTPFYGTLNLSKLSLLFL